MSGFLVLFHGYNSLATEEAPPNYGLGYMSLNVLKLEKCSERRSQNWFYYDETVLLLIG